MRSLNLADATVMAYWPVDELACCWDVRLTSLAPK